MEKKTELKFRPLSSGLGFHPFADGLPYAPVAKTQTGSQSNQRPSLPTTPSSMEPSLPHSSNSRGQSSAPSSFGNFGAGAVSAGRPTFVPPQRPLPQKPAPLAPTLAGARLTSASATPVANAAPAPLLDTTERYGFGYMFKRVFAFIFDSTLNLGLCSLALLASLWKQGLNLELLVNPGVALLVALFMTAFNWAVITAQEVAFGTSIGKRIFKLALDGPISVIFLRSILFLLSFGLGGLGIIWAIFDKKRRCWHDVVVDVQPVELARL